MRRTPLGFYSLVAFAGFLIVCTLVQLAGALLFQEAVEKGKDPGQRLEAMSLPLKVQPFHSFYWFFAGRELQELATGQGITLAERQRLLDRAEKYLQKAVSLEPTASLYHFHLGWVYVALSPYQPSLRVKAEAAFSRAVSLNPTHTGFRRSIALYYLRRYALALKLDRKGYSDSDLVSARKKLQYHLRAYLKTVPPGRLNQILDRCFAVTQQYTDLKGFIPDEAPYHLGLAEFLSHRGMRHEAEEEFRKAVTQDPTNSKVYHAYGSALFEQGRYPEALHLWKKEQALDPEEPRPYLCRADAFWALNRRGEAIAELRRLVDLHPDSPSYGLLLARRIEEAGDTEEALKIYEQTLERSPGYVQAHVAVADYWIRQGCFRKAEVSLYRAISLKPMVAAYRDRLARLYFREKRYFRAIEEWERVLEEHPGSMAALKGIARSYEKLEAWTGALRYYRRALRLNPEDRSILNAVKRIESRPRSASDVCPTSTHSTSSVTDTGGPGDPPGERQSRRSRKEESLGGKPRQKPVTSFPRA